LQTLNFVEKEKQLMHPAVNELSRYKKYSFDPAYNKPDSLPNSSGLYMICAKDPIAIGLFSKVKFFSMDVYQILYIGVSSKQGLRMRDYKNHFKGTARSSTLRKSLGSLLGWQAAQVYYNDGKYKFNNEREQALTSWMEEHLIMIYWVITGVDINSLETRLINELSPPLNISKNHSSINEVFRKRLKELRG